MPAVYGGMKLVGIDLTDNSIFSTILFPTTVAYSDSVSNPFRFLQHLTSYDLIGTSILMMFALTFGLTLQPLAKVLPTSPIRAMKDAVAL